MQHGSCDAAVLAQMSTHNSAVFLTTVSNTILVLKFHYFKYFAQTLLRNRCPNRLWTSRQQVGNMFSRSRLFYCVPKRDTRHFRL